MPGKPTWSPRKLKLFIFNQKANSPELRKQKGYRMLRAMRPALRS